jgi:hypothetical protein
MGTFTLAYSPPKVAAGKFGVLFGAEDATTGTAYTTSDGSGFAHVGYSEVVSGTTNGTSNRGVRVAPTQRILNLFPNDELTAISIRRGRTRPDQWDDVGECIITVNNATGSSDPDNYDKNTGGRYQRLTTPSSGTAIPATATYRSWLQPGMYGQVCYSTNGTTNIPLFTGVLEQVEPTDDRYSTATYTFVDRMALLGRATLVNGAKVGATGDTGRQRLNLIAQSARLYDLINGNGGNNVIEQVLDIKGCTRRLSQGSTGDTALDAIKSVIAGEAGRVFSNRSGLISMWDRANMATAGTTMAGTFTDTPASVAGYGYDEIQSNQAQNFLYNSAVVNVGSAIAASAKLDDSIATYGERRYEIDCSLQSTTDALNLATFWATNWSNPSKSVASLSLQAYAFSDADFAALAAIDLQQGVRVYRTLPGSRTLDVNCIVEGIEIDITPSGERFTFYLSARDTTTYT